MIRRLLALACMLLPPPLAAQDKPAATDSAAARAQSAARSDLRNLLVEQEVYFSANARYASTVAQLGPGFKPSEGHTVTFAHAERNGWSAVLTSVRFEGSCTIWVNVPAGKRVASERDKRVGEDGEPVCDAPAAPGRRP